MEFEQVKGPFFVFIVHLTSLGCIYFYFCLNIVFDSFRLLYVADSTKSVHLMVGIYHHVVIHSALEIFVSNLRLPPRFLLQKYMPFGARMLYCLGRIPLSGIVVSQGIYMFSFSRECQIVFPSGGKSM